MKYRAFIEDYFLIDEPKTGQLVPFKFNKVQIMYYAILCALGIEITGKSGIAVALREFIVKARREGFSSLILALFAADDILQENPTESMVISYKDDATAKFRQRYRRYVLSWYARKAGETVEAIQNNPQILEKYKKACFSVDSSDIELRHNQAHFYCGTAAARTGGRGGVLQKLLFSEAAHYQDTEKITAKEIIEGTSQQVDKASGWIFQETTANGVGNYHYQTYESIIAGLSRYVLRFFGWRDFYTEEQFAVIKSEFTDQDMVKQEYPETVEEAFLSSNLSFTSKDKLLALVGVNAEKKIYQHIELEGGNYIDQCETILDALRVIVKLNPNRDFYVGIDCAKITDRTIVTILMGKDLTPRGGIKAIAIDATGAGDFMPDWFEKNSKYYVVRMKFSRPTKSTMYKTLQVVIEDKGTELPTFMVGTQLISDEWAHFFKQMLGLKKELIGEMLVVEHPKGSCNQSNHNYDTCPYHDDYPDSWCLAEIAYVSINGVPDGKRPPEESGNFSSSVRRLLNEKGRRRNNADDD